MVPASAYAAGNILTSPIVPSMTEFIPMLIAFAIVAFVLIKLVWPRILPILDARAEKIENSLKSAEEAKLESENLLEEVKAKAEENNREAAATVEAARRDGETQRAGIIAKAQEEAQDIIDKANKEAAAKKVAAAAEIKKSTVEAAVAIAAKLINEKVDERRADTLAGEYFAEMGSFNDN